MGLYDSVRAACPVCNKGVEFQTKAGACQLKTYPPYRVPPELALDLNGQVEACSACGSEVVLILAVPVGPLCMVAVPKSAYEGEDE